MISLALGGAGAVAIVICASLLAQLSFGKALSYLGERSIVVYLAFFLPMVIARLALTRFFPELDGGTMAATATLFAVVTPLIGLAVVNRIGFGHFLFTRPNWATLNASPGTAHQSIQPAEQRSV